MSFVEIIRRWLERSKADRPPQNPDWIEIAEGELGVKEIEGSQHESTILDYLATCDNLGPWGKGRDETAWCSAFVNWCLEQAGLDSTRHALARSYIAYGDETEPRLGAIVVIRRRKVGQDASTGSRTGYHVGFFIRESDRSIRLLGGNQANRVSYRNFPKARYEVRAIRWPNYN